MAGRILLRLVLRMVEMLLLVMEWRRRWEWWARARGAGEVEADLLEDLGIFD
jgi:hypothetical protein